MDDPVVERLIELHKKLEAASVDGSIIQGWRPLRFDNKGWIVAGKYVDGSYHIEEFYPTGNWKKAAEYLEIEKELRTLLFSDLTPEQLNSYRATMGLAKTENPT